MSTKPSDRELLGRIWRLTWPTVLHSLLEVMLGLVDLLMVRPFGAEATAAIGLARQITFLVAAAAIAVSVGVVTLVSQGVGAGDRQQVEGAVRQSLRLVLILGLPITVAGLLLARPLMVLMQASAATLAGGVPYLQVFFLGIVFLWANFLLGAVFRGAGDAMTPLKIALGVNLLNVGLNYIFIFGLGPVPAFEVPGAAIGTVGARAIGAAILLALLLRGTQHVRLRLRPWWELDFALMGRILRIGAPIALAGVLRNSSRLVFLAIVGASALRVSVHAAVGVGLQVRLISVLPALAFQTATATLVGQAIGRRAYDEAEALGNRSVLLLLGLMVAVVGVILALAEPLAAVFLSDPTAAELGAKVLRWFAVAQLFSALAIGTQGALNGAGDTLPAARYMLVSQWLVMLPLSWLLLVPLGWDPDGPLAAWTLAPLISLVLTQRRFRRGKWKSLRV